MPCLRLYVICHRCCVKILIQSTAKVRGELPYAFELECYLRHRDIYYRHEVFAEPEVGKGPAGAIIVGLLGAIIAGPIGALGGVILGGGAGASFDRTERQAVARFNAS